MKKLLFCIAMPFLLSPVMADDEVYLDLNPTEFHQYKTFSPDFHNEKTEKEDEFDTDMILHPFNYLRKEFLDLQKEEH